MRQPELWEENHRSQSSFRDPFLALNDPQFWVALKSPGSGSRRTYNRFFALARPLLRARIQKSFTDPLEVEEVLSETLLALVSGLKHFRGEARLTTWIYGILQHKVCDHIARLQRIRKWSTDNLEQGDEPMTQSDEFGSTPWDSSPDTLREHTRLKAWITEGLQQMSPIDAEAWTLREWEGLTTEAAAEKLGISGEAFRVRLFRARQRMTTLIKARFQGMQVIASQKPTTQTRILGLLRAA